MKIGYEVNNLKIGRMHTQLTHVLDVAGYQAFEFFTVNKTRHVLEMNFYNFKHGAEANGYLKDKAINLPVEDLFERYKDELQPEVTMKFRKKLLRGMFNEHIEVAENVTLEELYNYCVEIMERVMSGETPPSWTGGIEVYSNGELTLTA